MAYLRQISIVVTDEDVHPGTPGSEDVAQALRNSCVFKDVRVGGPDRPLLANERYIDVNLRVWNDYAWTWFPRDHCMGCSSSGVGHASISRGGFLLGALAVVGGVVFFAWPVIPRWGVEYGTGQVVVSDASDNVVWRGYLAVADPWSLVVYSQWREPFVDIIQRHETFRHLLQQLTLQAGAHVPF